MNLKILYKKYPRNQRDTNNVYFELDGKEMQIRIVYIESWKRNVFLDGYDLKQLESYIKEHYDCTFSEFQEYFLYKLYEYSRHRNLEYVKHKDLSKIEYKEAINE